MIRYEKSLYLSLDVRFRKIMYSFIKIVKAIFFMFQFMFCLFFLSFSFIVC